MKFKVYISGAITGTDDYMKRFADAERYLTDNGHEVINPAEINSHLPESTTYEEYMAISFELLKQCNTIFMLDGWRESCGANREYGYAMAIGYRIMNE